MNKIQRQVKEFMLNARQDCPDKATVPDASTRILRARLLLEEVFEYIEASGLEAVIDGKKIEFDKILFREDDPCGNPADLVKMVDAIADISYVNYGAAVSCGVDMEPIETEVHRSNISKFIDGYEDTNGKWIKGPSFSPPDIKSYLESQYGGIYSK
jgi:predicted HAD superfamily Cof-like phosphohydrolase